MEMALFVDQELWEKFSSKHGYEADNKLRDYLINMMNNVSLGLARSSLRN